MQFFEVLTGGVSPVVNQDFSFAPRMPTTTTLRSIFDSSDDLNNFLHSIILDRIRVGFVAGRLAGDPLKHARNAGALSSWSEGVHDQWNPMGRLFGLRIDPSDQTAIWVAASTPRERRQDSIGVHG